MSGANELDIWNLALSHLDLSQRVQSVTEQSPQAGYCRQFYDRARKYILEQCYWSFATTAKALPLLLDQQTISVQSSIIFPGWRYIYSRPLDCLMAQAVTTLYGLRINPRLGSYFGTYNSWSQNRPAWTEMLDQVQTNPGQTIDILTDQSNAWLVYTVDVTNVGVFSETLVDCIAWQMGTLISGPASANQKAKEMCLKMAPLALSRALAQNLNEQQEDPYPDSPSIQARF